MSTSQFAVSLRVFSEAVDVGEICENIGLEPTTKQRIGEQRKTPKGTVLDGIYASNYCVFSLKQQDEEEMSEMLERVCDLLGKSHDFFKKIRGTGGRAELFVGWYLTGNTGDTFSSQLLRKLSELELDLALDIYGTENDSGT